MGNRTADSACNGAIQFPHGERARRRPLVTPAGPRPARPRDRVRRLLRAIQAALAAGTLALVAAACGGGGGSPGVAALGNKSAETTTAAAPAGSPGQVSSKVQAQLLSYSACMRKNGVPNFPDMKPGTNIKVGPGTGLDPSSPLYQSANKACQHLMPQLSPAQQQQSNADALKFSRCMRAHGLPNFPDPTFSPGANWTLPSGMHFGSPQFQAAQRECSAAWAAFNSASP